MKFTINCILPLVSIMILTSSCAENEGSEIIPPTHSYNPTNVATQIAETPSPPPTSTITLTPLAISDPPRVLPRKQGGFLEEGSLLLNYSGPSVPGGVWKIGAHSSDPVILIDSIPSARAVFLSDDGRWLTWREYDPSKMVVYDLLNAQELKIDWDDQWKRITGWTQDGKIRIIIQNEHIWEVGIKQKYDLLDPTDLSFKTIIYDVTLELYRFDDRFILGGYASFDPETTRVLYTAMGRKGIDTILVDLSTNKELWRHEGSYSQPNLAPAVWSVDGTRVAFTLRDEDSDFLKIFTMTRNGNNIKDLTPQPIQTEGQYLIRYLAWSQDSNYLHFSLWQTAEQGPGFILNTETTFIREISIESRAFRSGQWIPSNHLIYSVRNNLDARIELWILNLDSWTTQELTWGGADYRFQIIGWTPLSLP